MSELINNHEYRQKILKELIMELHQGKSVEEVKARFEKLIEGISALEITEMEQALILEGMPVEEIQNLCDVHAAVFKGSIEEIHSPQKAEDTPGHPIHTFKLENRELEKLIKDVILPVLEDQSSSNNSENMNRLMKEAFSSLGEIDKHYSRKENLLFPLMEKHGITAPPKVMWGVDDEIRDAIKEIRKFLENDVSSLELVAEKGRAVAERVPEMIFKEENILFPMILESFSEEEWVEIAEASDEIGYCLIKPQGIWKPVQVKLEKQKAEKEKNKGEGFMKSGQVEFDAGQLSTEEINALLNTLPIDITFVDKNDTVKYFTQGKERIFARAKTILGRKVENCHPPASVHIVEKIVEDLKSGKKDNEDFWLKLGDKFVYIRYFAVRNAKGEFLGVMEVTQDIKPIQEITGEKRLMSD
ncbi:DUF438 domain-containing protein [Desulfitobacterium metallireducens]|uniref:DUF438 domain-containing protein n=1 Tax=Desulfitobacterium metallireducens DSM 15288 TaxID=871968 RepID=W0E8W3_9FIRM|nr:DUF438 domain-containing protein [Desulfitobacterium metallireducens]AHF05973.1 hypothetical protein DESME_01930 [Desulfitobacterium metallireducens DSM 15288]